MGYCCSDPTQPITYRTNNPMQVSNSKALFLFKNIFFSEGFMYMHHPQISEVIKMIKNGKLWTIASSDQDDRFGPPGCTLRRLTRYRWIGMNSVWPVGTLSSDQYMSQFSSIPSQFGSTVQISLWRRDGSLPIPNSLVFMLRVMILLCKLFWIPSSSFNLGLQQNRCSSRCADLATSFTNWR